MYGTFVVVEVSLLSTRVPVPPVGAAVFRAVPIAVVFEGCCSAKASANELESTFVGVAKLTTRLLLAAFPDIIYTANTVRLLVVFAVGPWNHDDPPKFMVGCPLRPVLLMVGGPADGSTLHIPPPSYATAANLVPSELDAIDRQFEVVGVVVCGVQSPAPELAFVHIPPPAYATAANFVPSELDAILVQFEVVGADV
jgi:hypothetical protein